MEQINFRTKLSLFDFYESLDIELWDYFKLFFIDDIFLQKVISTSGITSRWPVYS